MADRPKSGFTFKDVTAVVIRGRDLESDGSIRRAGWEVFRHIRINAQREDPDGIPYKGAPGYRWRGNIRQVFSELWPASQEVIPGQNHDAGRWAVQQWMQSSGNLVNLELGAESSVKDGSGPRLSVWWIPREFRGVVPEDEEQQDTAPEPEPEPEDEEIQAASGLFCAEPGCNRGPFNTSGTRASHENTRHPDSPWRVYVCPTCHIAYFRWVGLGIHIAREHHIDRTRPEFNVLKQQAESQARTRLEELERNPPAEMPSVPMAPVPAVPAEQQVLKPPVIIPDGFAPPPGPVQGPPVPAPAPVRQPVPVPAACVPAKVKPEPAAETEHGSGYFKQALTVLSNLHREYDKVTAERNQLQEQVTALRAENDKLRTAQQGSDRIRQVLQLMKDALNEQEG